MSLDSATDDHIKHAIAMLKQGSYAPGLPPYTITQIAIQSGCHQECIRDLRRVLELLK